MSGKIKKYFSKFLAKSASLAGKPKMLLPGEKIDSIKDFGPESWAVSFKKDGPMQKLKSRLTLKRKAKLKKKKVTFEEFMKEAYA
jgi:hypothetical protein